MEKSELVVVAAPGPINPLKTTLGLSVIHSMPGAQCFLPSVEGRKSPVFPTHRPSHACDPYTNTPVIGTGRQTESLKTTTAHTTNRSTFFPFLVVLDNACLMDQTCDVTTLELVSGWMAMSQTF